MPFLLAEILNFQGSIHRIGVGSFSYFIYLHGEYIHHIIGMNLKYVKGIT